MDSLIDCGKFVNHILEETGNDLSLSIDETTWVPRVVYSQKTVYLPFYLDALLVLDEIGTIDQFLCFYLALYMLQNYEYDLCEDLLNKLYQSEFPKCSDAKTLYETTATKQFFIILHECGHNLNFTQKGFKYLFEKILIKDIYLTQEGKFSPDGYVKPVLGTIISENRLDTDSSKYVIDLYTNLQENRNVLEKEYFNDDNKSEETCADLAALLLMKYFVNPVMNVTAENMVRAIFFVQNLSILERIMNEEHLKERADNVEHDLSVNLSRLNVSAAFAYNYFDDDNTIDFETFIFSYLDKEVSLGLRIKDYQKYIDSWREGNDKEKDEQKHKRLQDEIYKCYVALKQLYQFEE